MFGNKGEDPAVGATQEAARLAALPLRDLGVEIMQRGFGATLAPEWKGTPGVTAIDNLLTALVPGSNYLQTTEQRAAYDVIGEGVQQLEHAALVRLTYMENVGGRLYAITRVGRDALARGAVAGHL